MNLLLTLGHSIPELIDSDILQLLINSKLRLKDTFLSIFHLFELSLFTRRHATASSKICKSCLDTSFILFLTRLIICIT